MNLGILLWLERKNALNDSAVVDGRLAISSKFGDFTVLSCAVGLILWQLPQIIVATRSPDDVLAVGD